MDITERVVQGACCVHAVGREYQVVGVLLESLLDHILFNVQRLARQEIFPLFQGRLSRLEEDG